MQHRVLWKSNLLVLAVATQYAKSSVEYSTAGGAPKNQRRKGLRGESPVSNLQQPSFIASVNGNGSKNGNQNGNKAATTS